MPLISLLADDGSHSVPTANHLGSRKIRTQDADPEPPQPGQLQIEVAVAGLEAGRAMKALVHVASTGSPS